MIGLKQRYAISPPLPNQYIIRKMIQNVNLETNIDTTRIDGMGFDDNLNLVGVNIKIVTQNINKKGPNQYI